MADPILNVLADRYASDAMVELWSRSGKVVQERRLWIAVLRAQQSLGVDISDQAIADYEEAVEKVDLASIDEREAVTRHDVKARIDEFCALAGHEQIHRGMTSRDLTENIEQLQVRDGLRLLVNRLVAVVNRMADLADAHAGTAIVARTHNVAAQLTTLGKRFADGAEETMLGLERIEELLGRYPLRGIKGAVGTRADQLDLLGDPDSVDRLEQAVASQLGFDRLLDSTGQVYPRSLDLDVVSALVQAVSGPSSLATTIRLMAGHDLVGEGFRSGQIGSSALPHKMNPRSSERIGALRVVLDGHLTMAAALSGRQWSEGDVSCSVARRVLLPDSFLTADAILQTTLGVLEEIDVFPDVAAAEVDREISFLATSRMMTKLVEAGLGRERAHELVKEHAIAAARARRSGLRDVDLVAMIGADERAPIGADELRRLLDEPLTFSGTVADQIDRVVRRSRELAALHPEAAVVESQMTI